MSYLTRISQNIAADTNNSSSTNIAASALFVGTATSTLGAAGIQVSLKTDQNCTVYVDQAPDTALKTGKGTVATNNSTTLTGTGTEFTRELHQGDTIVYDAAGVNLTRVVDQIISDTSLTVTVAFTGGSLSGKTYQHYPWDISDSYDYYAAINNFGVTVQAINSYVRVRVKNIGSATTNYFRLQTVLCPIVETVPRSLSDGGDLKTKVEAISDEYGFEVENTPMGEMRTVVPTRLVGAIFDGSQLDSNFWTNLNVAGGTTTQSGGNVQLSTNTTANGSTSLYSVRRARYVSSNSLGYRSVVRLGDTGTVSNMRRWGAGLIANYSITISSANIVAGDIYTNNSQQFTILKSGTGVTTMLAQGSGNPGAGAQTYTRQVGTGPATLTGSAFASAATVTDGVWFQLNESTFSIVTAKGDSQTTISSGSFNGILGSTYTPGTSATTYEIYWTNSKVYFVVGGKLLHTVSASSGTWTNSVTLYIFADNVNSGGSVSAVDMFMRVASIRRLGQLNTEYNSRNITSATTTVCKYGAGRLQNITINDVNNTTGLLTVYDSVTAAGSKIATINIPKNASLTPVTLNYDLPFHYGLTLVSAVACDVTVTYE